MELRDYLRILRKRRWVVILSLVACLGGAGVGTVVTTPVYEARAKLFVGQRQIATTEIQPGVQIQQLALQLLKTYAQLIRTRPVADRAVQADDLPLSSDQVLDGIRAEPILDTQLIEVSFQSTDPELAQRVVNAVARSFVDEVERIEKPRTPNAEPAVKVDLVEPAIRPAEPVRPRPVRNLALAMVLGSMLGVGLAFLAEYLDTSVRSPQEVEELTGVPVLAGIPHLGVRAGEVHLERDPQSAGAEAFRKLRTAIQFLGVDRPVHTILVTSPFAQEGKTTTSLNLAVAFAQAGLRTVLVEADLRRPALHRVFGSPDQRGLTTALIGRVPLEQAIQPASVRNLFRIMAGAVPPNPAELLASEHMADLLRRLRLESDIVVVDAPPLLPVADASAIAPRADGVLLVVRSGVTHRDRLKEASRLVDKVGGRLLGVVLNDVSHRDAEYGYYYSGYSGYSPAKAPFETGASRLEGRPVSPPEPAANPDA